VTTSSVNDFFDIFKEEDPKEQIVSSQNETLVDTQESPSITRDSNQILADVYSRGFSYAKGKSSEESVGSLSDVLFGGTDTSAHAQWSVKYEAEDLFSPDSSKKWFNETGGSDPYKNPRLYSQYRINDLYSNFAGVEERKRAERYVNARLGNLSTEEMDAAALEWENSIGLGQDFSDSPLWPLERIVQIKEMQPYLFDEGDKPYRMHGPEIQIDPNRFESAVRLAVQDEVMSPEDAEELLSDAADWEAFQNTNFTEEELKIIQAVPGFAYTWGISKGATSFAAFPLGAKLTGKALRPLVGRIPLIGPFVEHVGTTAGGVVASMVASWTMDEVLDLAEQHSELAEKFATSRDLHPNQVASGEFIGFAVPGSYIVGTGVRRGSKAYADAVRAGDKAAQAHILSTIPASAVGGATGYVSLKGVEAGLQQLGYMEGHELIGTWDQEVQNLAMLSLLSLGFRGRTFKTGRVEIDTKRAIEILTSRPGPRDQNFLGGKDPSKMSRRELKELQLEYDAAIKWAQYSGRFLREVNAYRKKEGLTGLTSEQLAEHFKIPATVNLDVWLQADRLITIAPRTQPGGAKTSLKEQAAEAARATEQVVGLEPAPPPRQRTWVGGRRREDSVAEQPQKDKTEPEVQDAKVVVTPEEAAPIVKPEAVPASKPDVVPAPKTESAKPPAPPSAVSEPLAETKTPVESTSAKEDAIESLLHSGQFASEADITEADITKEIARNMGLDVDAVDKARKESEVEQAKQDPDPAAPQERYIPSDLFPGAMIDTDTNTITSREEINRKQSDMAEPVAEPTAQSSYKFRPLSESIPGAALDFRDSEIAERADKLGDKFAKEFIQESSKARANLDKFIEEARKEELEEGDLEGAQFNLEKLNPDRTDFSREELIEQAYLENAVNRVRRIERKALEKAENEKYFEEDKRPITEEERQEVIDKPYGEKTEHDIVTAVREGREFLQKWHAEKEAEKQKQIDEVEAEKSLQSVIDLSYPLAGRVREAIKDSDVSQKDIRQWARETMGEDYKPREASDIVEAHQNRVYFQEQRPEAADSIDPQTARSEEQIAFQQFSTPPKLANFVADLSLISPGDIVLEPSAGTGALVSAAISKAPGEISVYANEIDPARAKLIEDFIGGEISTPEFRASLKSVTKEDAEHIDALLEKVMGSEKPSVVVMNPPFSRRGDKSTKRDIHTGGRHVTAALNAVQDGGRVVAIVGGGMRGSGGMLPTSKAHKEWFEKTLENATIKSIFQIPGKAYSSMGTKFNTNVMVIDKVATGQKLEDIPINKMTVPQWESIGNFPFKSNPLQVKSDNPLKREQLGAEKTIETQTESAEVVGRPTGEAVPEPSGQARPEGRVQPDAGIVEPQTGELGAGEPASITGEGRGVGVVAEPTEGIPGQARPEPAPEKAIPEGGAQVPAEGVEQPAAGRGEPVSTEPSGEQPLDISTAPNANKPDATSVRSRIDTLYANREAALKDDQGAFRVYKPNVEVKDSKQHPGTLVESKAMSAIAPPPVEADVKVPNKIVKDGSISDVQIEAVALASAAHETVFPNGTRQGFFCGDGTGVGKSRIVAGIILDNFYKGRKKSVLVTKNESLVKDFKDLFEELDPNVKVLSISETKKDDQIPSDFEGVVVMTYGIMGRAWDDAKKTSPRLSQVYRWLEIEAGTGKPVIDFDGPILFDESHMMGNATETKGARGAIKASKQGIAGVSFTNRFENARVTYLSATGATTLNNLAYAGARMGLWGTGTQFANMSQFFDNITAAGMSGLEIVAQDLKARGLYLARTISMQDVEVRDPIVHNLTPQEEEMYTNISDQWGKVMSVMEDVLRDQVGDKNLSKARGNVASTFYGTTLRFFQQFINGLKAPALVADAKRELENGNAVVIQLTNTGESQAKSKRLAAKEAGLEETDLEMSMKDIFMDYVEKSFPIHRMEVVEDQDGREIVRKVEDSSGNPVVDPSALRRRDMLMSEIADMSFPQNALDYIIQEFGEDGIAEITGRTERRVFDEEGVARLQKRGSKANEVEEKRFTSGQVYALVFSNAGATGKTYSAEKSFANQRRRVHYMFQPDWRADTTVQALGRTHRSNQTSAPIVKVVNTNVEGEKRFTSAIIKKLEQMGALTRGSRSASGGSVFDARSNLDSDNGRAALQQLFKDIHNNKVPPFDIDYLENNMGLKITTPEGDLKKALPNVGQFMNRVMMLPPERQDMIMEEFNQNWELIDQKQREEGTLDVGMQEIPGISIVKTDDIIISQEDKGSDLRMVKLEVESEPVLREYRKTRFGAVLDLQNNTPYMIVNKKTEIVGGRYQDQYILQGPLVLSQRRKIVAASIDNPEKFRRLDEAEAKNMFDSQEPGTQMDSHYIVTGALLQHWTRFDRKNFKIRRAVTNDGEQILGLEVNKTKANQLMEDAGKAFDLPAGILDPQMALDNLRSGAAKLIRFANGFIIRTRKMDEQNFIVVMASATSEMDSGTRDMLGLPHRTRGTKNIAHLPQDPQESFRAMQKIYNMTKPVSYTGTVMSSVDNRPMTGGGGGAASVSALLHPRPFDAMGATGKPGSVIGPRGEVTDPVRSAVDMVGDDRKPSVGNRSPINMVPERFRDEYKRSGQGVGKTRTVIDSIKMGSEFVKRLITRGNFEHLPQGRYGEIRNLLRDLSQSRAKSVDEAIDIIVRTAKMMNNKDYQIFTQKVIIDDFIAMREEDPEIGLPWGVTEEELTQWSSTVNEYVAGNESIKAAIKYRNYAWGVVRDSYIHQAKEAGWKSADSKLTRKDYFPHMVLKHANKKSKSFADAKPLSMPTQRGYLRQRTGSEEAINANYHQAEFSVLQQVLTDIETMRIIGEIRKKEGIIETLKKQATQMNIQAAVAADFGLAPNENPTPDMIDTFLGRVGRKTAIGFSTIINALATGDAPKAPFEWFEVLEDAAIQAKMKSIQEGDMEEFTLSSLSLGEKEMPLLYQYMSWIMKQSDIEVGTESTHELAKLGAATIFKGTAEKRAAIAQGARSRGEYVTWRDLIPEGYTEYRLRDELAPMYKAFALSDQIAYELLEQKEMSIPANALQEVMAQGKQYDPEVLPERIVKQLDTEARKAKARSDKDTRSIIIRGLDKVTSAWRRWTLLNPIAAASYNIRNMTEVGKVAIIEPGVMMNLPEAAWQLTLLFLNPEKASADAAYWKKKGGLRSLPSRIELQNLANKTNLKKLKALRNRGAWDFTKGVPTMPFRIYWNTVTKFTEFREALMRFSAYTYYLKHARKNNGNITRLGASGRKEIRAIEKNEDKAFKMSDDLLGAYGDISQLGQHGRQSLIPFWSFRESNMKAYAKAIHNKFLMAIAKGRMTYDFMNKMPLLKYTPIPAAAGIGRSLLGALAGVAGVLLAEELLHYWWNEEYHADLIDDVPEHVKRGNYVILGRDEEGNALYFNRTGTIQDFYETIGLGSAAWTAEKYLRGEDIEFQKEVQKSAKQTFQNYWDMVGPAWKMPLAAAGIDTFPNVFEGKVMTPEQRIHAMAKIWSLESASRWIMDAPDRSFKDQWTKRMANAIEPNRAAYQLTRNEVSEWMDENGITRTHSINQSGARPDALRRMREAQWYEDKHEFATAFLDYAMTFESGEDMVAARNQSIKYLHPLGALNDEQKQAYMSQITPEQERMYDKAQLYWETRIAEGFWDYVDEVDRAGLLELPE
tara:strand:- start:22239 stop:33200 length:10962 start_codon:yes stop_codon:yes gene_type:complete